MEKVNYFLRPMKDEDISQVSEIDREAFPAESMFRPYSSYKQEIHNSSAHYIVAYTERDPKHEDSRQKIPWLKHLFHSGNTTTTSNKEQDNPHKEEYILGFVGLWIMLNEAHIIAIAVRNNYRRLGIGEDLLIAIIEQAMQLSANVVTLEVRDSNDEAQELYNKYGFHVVGRRPRYYSDNNEDAVLMSTDSTTFASFQSHFQALKLAHKQRGNTATTG